MEDKRKITAIQFIPGNKDVAVGFDNVSKIEPYEENGVSWLAIHEKNKLVARLAAEYCVIHYSSVEDAK